MGLGAQTFDSDRMVEFLKHIETADRAMGSLSIWQSGEEVFFHSIGYARIEDEKKANEETIYRVGSLNKTFTAVIILLLEEKGLLKTSDALEKYFPGIANSGEITLDHLLLHRSGIYNFTNAEDYSNWMTKEKGREELLEMFYGFEPVFNPGDRTEYSNTNYLLLSFIAEDVSGKTYEQLLEEYIALPLGLNNTFIARGLSSVDNHAFSYHKLQNWELEAETNPGIPMGAGALSSNVRELNQFLHSLFNGKILQEQSLEKMITVTGSFGLGIAPIPFYDKISWGHTGGIDGFFAVFSYFPEDEVVLSVTFNGLATSGNDLLIGILSIFFGRDYELPEFKEAVILDIEELNQYPGNYTSPQFPLDILIIVKNNTLYAQASGQPSFPLEARGDHVFAFDQAGLELRFEPQKDIVILRQGGMEFQLSRAED